MRRRVNFFRTVSTAAPQRAVGQAASLGVMRRDSYHGLFAMGVVAIAVLYLGGNYVRFQRQAGEFQARLLSAERELKLASETLSRVTAEKQKQEPARQPAGFDGTWTSLVWKVSTFTPATEILLQNLELGTAGGAAGSARTLGFKGLARSLRAVQWWLEALSASLPGFDFVLERQGTGSNPNYPVEFRVVASSL